MAVVVPDPRAIREFATQAAFEAWLSRHHDVAPELWLKIHKKASGLPTVSYAEAVDVALCWGWIDGLKKSLDERSFLQRFTPRKGKSAWSQINRGHVARLVDAGRMTPHGLRHVEAAKADGRWEAAYAPASTMTLPDDLATAIAASPEASAALATLDRANRYALAFRVRAIKTPASRRARIAAYVAMLARGETIHAVAKKEASPKKAAAPKNVATRTKGARKAPVR